MWLTWTHGDTPLEDRSEAEINAGVIIVRIHADTPPMRKSLKLSSTQGVIMTLTRGAHAIEKAKCRGNNGGNRNG